MSVIPALFGTLPWEPPFIYSSCRVLRYWHVLGELKYSAVFWQVVFLPGRCCALRVHHGCAACYWKQQPVIPRTSGVVTPGLQSHLLRGPTAGAADTSSVLSETGNEPEGAAGVLSFPNNRTDRGASGVASLCVSHQGNEKKESLCLQTVFVGHNAISTAAPQEPKLQTFSLWSRRRRGLV